MADAEEVLARRLSSLGLRDIEGMRTHSNRTVMITLTASRMLRLHRGYALAPDRVLRAIVRFLSPRVPRPLRRLAEREFLAFPVEEHTPAATMPPRSDRPQPGDLLHLHRLQQLHQRFNEEHFGGVLSALPLRISGRMRTRLGELSVDLRTGRPIEIAISRRHLTRHPWPEVEHTLLHEMVHQWQAETGLSVDHGPTFRDRARMLGVLPRAKRGVGRGVGRAAEG